MVHRASVFLVLLLSSFSAKGDGSLIFYALSLFLFPFRLQFEDLKQTQIMRQWELIRLLSETADGFIC